MSLDATSPRRLAAQFPLDAVEDHNSVLVAAELPIFVKRPSTAYCLLGGEAQVAASLATNRTRAGVLAQREVLPLYLRPEDPVSHPAVGEACKSASFLLRVERRVKRSSSAGQVVPSAERLSARILGPVARTFRFNTMADFQYLPSSCPLVLTAPIVAGALQEVRDGHVQQAPEALIAAMGAEGIVGPKDGVGSASDSTEKDQFRFLGDLEKAGPFYSPPQFSPYGTPQLYKLSSNSVGALAALNNASAHRDGASGMAGLEGDIDGDAAKDASDDDEAGRDEAPASSASQRSAAVTMAARRARLPRNDDNVSDDGGRSDDEGAAQLSQRRALFRFEDADANAAAGSAAAGSQPRRRPVPSMPLEIDSAGSIKRLEELRALLKQAFQRRPVWTKDALEAFLGARALSSHHSSSSSSSASSSLLPFRASLSADLIDTFGVHWPKALVAYAYFTRSGAFRNCWLRLGYDPRDVGASGALDDARSSDASTEATTKRSIAERKALVCLYQYVEAKIPDPYRSLVCRTGGDANASEDEEALSSLYPTRRSVGWPGGEANKRRIGVQLIDLFSMGAANALLPLLSSPASDGGEAEYTATGDRSRVVPSSFPRGLFEASAALEREEEASRENALSSSSSLASSLNRCAIRPTLIVAQTGHSAFEMSEEKLLESVYKVVLLAPGPHATSVPMGARNLGDDFDPQSGWLSKRALEGYRAFTLLMLCTYLEETLLQKPAIRPPASALPEFLCAQARRGTLAALVESARKGLVQSRTLMPASFRLDALLERSTAVIKGGQGNARSTSASVEVMHDMTRTADESAFGDAGSREQHGGAGDESSAGGATGQKRTRSGHDAALSSSESTADESPRAKRSKQEDSRFRSFEH